MTHHHSTASLVALIQSAVSAVRCDGKVGRRLLQPSIAAALRQAEFDVDEEDERGFMAPGMPPWRSKATGLPAATRSRRRIDLVVYSEGQPVALIETESDLAHLRKPGIVSTASGRYDVQSIAFDADGRPFESYMSLERMAAAAFYAAVSRSSGSYPSPAEGCRLLERIRSDRPEDHNPDGLLMVLVAGRVRAADPALLAARLQALGAHLVTGDQA